MKVHSTAARTTVFQGLSAATQTAWILGFAILTAIGAQVEIPNHPVPFTLQTLFVLLAGSILGSRYGALSMGAYLFAGILGMPVFSGAGFGLAKILGPTGGYLLAFPVAAFVIGSIVRSSPTLPRLLLAHLSGLIIIFTMGTLHLSVMYLHDLGAAFSSGFLLFSWWDILKLGATTGIAYGYFRR
jgi:biotin transport system substrate-specific component